MFTIIKLLHFLQAHRHTKEMTSDGKGKSKTREQQESLIVTNLVQVFVGARPVIPRHRAMSIFEALVTTIGAKDYLCHVVSLLIHGGCMGTSLKIENKEMEVLKRVEGTNDDDVCKNSLLNIQF